MHQRQNPNKKLVQETSTSFLVVHHQHKKPYPASSYKSTTKTPQQTSAFHKLKKHNVCKSNQRQQLETK